MSLRSAFIISTAILFLSVPAWGDSMKFKSGGDSADAIHFHPSWHTSSHSNIKFLGGFKTESNKHDGFFKFHEGHFVLVVPSEGGDWQGSNNGSNSDPISTPEPAALSLLLAGFVALGAFTYRRNPSLVGAR